MELRRSGEYGNLLRLRADQFTTTRRVGLTEIFSSGQRLLSLRSAMATIVGYFITWYLIARENTVSAPALPVLDKFCFQLRK